MVLIMTGGDHNNCRRKYSRINVCVNILKPPEAVKTNWNLHNNNQSGDKDYNSEIRENVTGKEGKIL